MATWKVAKVPDGKVSDDGMNVTLRVQLADGQEHHLEIAYDQLEFAAQALLQLSHGAFQEQVRRGRLPFVANWIANPMQVESYRLMRDNEKQHLLIQMHGRKIPSAPLGIGSFVLDEPLARNLSQDLTESVELLRQSKRPS